MPKKKTPTPPVPPPDDPVVSAAKKAAETIRQAAIERMKPKYTTGRYAGIVFSTDKHVAAALEWAADEVQKIIIAAEQSRK